MFQSLAEKISRYSRRWLSTIPDAGQVPLLDETELAKLALYAQSLSEPLFEFQRHATHPLIGETLSMHRGRGYEFDENRAYQVGDESRLLNWRMYARTGKLYTRVFTEERRPQVFIIVDRRATMRFATRHQLKAALAAKIAACYAYQARQQALAIGGLILNQDSEWFTPAVGEDALSDFVLSLSKPCAPLDFEGDQPSLEEILQLLLHRLPAGCFLLLLSDFCDLDPELHVAELQHLAELHTVRAIQILDPIEQQLPAFDLLIEDRGSSHPLRIDGRDNSLQHLYTQTFQDRQLKLAECFQSCHIPFKNCSTSDEVAYCVGAA